MDETWEHEAIGELLDRVGALEARIKAMLDRHRCRDCLVLLKVDEAAGTATRRCWVCGKEVKTKRTAL